MGLCSLLASLVLLLSASVRKKEEVQSGKRKTSICTFRKKPVRAIGRASHFSMRHSKKGNRPGSESLSSRSMNCSRYAWAKGLSAAFLVFVGVGIVLLFYSNPNTDEEQRPENTTKSVSPIRQKANSSQSNSGNVKRKKGNGTKTYFDEAGIERYPGGARVPRKNPNKVTLPDRRAVKWTFDCEDEICALVDMEPGDIVVGDIEYGEKFIVDFNNSLTNRITVSHDDDEYTRRLKEGVIAAKQDLYEAMNKGEDIAKIMTDTRREMRKLFEYKNMLEEEISQIRSSGDHSEAEIRDFVNAANVMLERKGLPPIHMPRMILKKFKRGKGGLVK